MAKWLRNLFLRCLDVLAALVVGIVLLSVLYTQLDTWLRVAHIQSMSACKPSSTYARNRWGQRYEDIRCDGTLLMWMEACDE